MEKQSWDQIEKDYDQQWVELVDYDWPEGKPFPKSGIVRVHESDRKKFYELAKVDAPKDSAILFVGKPEVPADTILCSSIMQIRNANN